MCSENLAESLVKKVSCRVVVLDLSPSLCIYMEAETLSAVCRDTLRYVDSKVVLLDCINDADLLAAL